MQGIVFIIAALSVFILAYLVGRRKQRLMRLGKKCCEMFGHPENIDMEGVNEKGNLYGVCPRCGEKVEKIGDKWQSQEESKIS